MIHGFIYLMLSLCVYSFHYVFITLTMCLKLSLWTIYFSYYVIYINYVVV
jgi:hypothetical protein